MDEKEQKYGRLTFISEIKIGFYNNEIVAAVKYQQATKELYND